MSLAAITNVGHMYSMSIWTVSRIGARMMSLSRNNMNTKEQLINDTIEDLINPGLEMHDGSVEVVSCELDSEPPLLKLSFKGICGSCPSSFSQTLRLVEELLREETRIMDLVVENVNEQPETPNLKYVFTPDDE